MLPAGAGLYAWDEWHWSFQAGSLDMLEDVVVMLAGCGAGEWPEIMRWKHIGNRQTSNGPKRCFMPLRSIITFDSLWRVCIYFSIWGWPNQPAETISSLGSYLAEKGWRSWTPNRLADTLSYTGASGSWAETEHIDEFGCNLWRTLLSMNWLLPLAM